jgi:hypothetical protein
MVMVSHSRRTAEFVARKRAGEQTLPIGRRHSGRRLIGDTQQWQHSHGCEVDVAVGWVRRPSCSRSRSPRGGGLARPGVLRRPHHRPFPSPVHPTPVARGRSSPAPARIWFGIRAIIFSTWGATRLTPAPAPPTPTATTLGWVTTGWRGSRSRLLLTGQCWRIAAKRECEKGAGGPAARK